jgi:nucleoside-diphosphate-sugar epimerase
MKALVTGATGFIGSHLTEKLLKAQFDVNCLVRNTSDLKWLEGLNVKLVKGDCCDRDSLEECTKGYDYIFHLAGLTKACRREEFYAVNSKGTKNLIESVVKNSPDVKRFVYLSSLSAFGPHIGSLHCEDQKPHPVSDYGKSKLEGERVVLGYSSKVAISILRPAAVYGPRDKDFFLIFKFIKRGIMPYWGDGRVSLIYIDDLVDAIMLAAENKNAIGKIYSLSDGAAYSFNEVIKEISLALDVKVLKVRLPRYILPVVGFLGDGISKIMGINSMINSDKVKELRYADWICDIEEISRDLNFEPKTDIKKGMRWTADWYRIHRWL